MDKFIVSCFIWLYFCCLFLKSISSTMDGVFFIFWYYMQSNLSCGRAAVILLIKPKRLELAFSSSFPYKELRLSRHCLLALTNPLHKYTIKSFIRSSIYSFNKYCLFSMSYIPEMKAPWFNNKWNRKKHYFFYCLYIWIE